MKHKLSLWLSSLAVIGLMLLLTGCKNSQPAAYDPQKPLGPQLNYTITGIDASAGEMDKATQALTAYGLKTNNWQLMPSSTAAMVGALDKAVQYKQPIVVTAYQPHWMFAKYPLKWLKDPKHVFGKTQHESTIARKGLKQDNPGAYQLLKNFHWTVEESYATMLKINAGVDQTKAAKQFIKTHPKRTQETLKNVPEGHNQEVKLVYTPYDYEVAVTSVVAQMLTDKGYKVTTQQLDVSVMWQAIAAGKVDATLVASLPTTHAAFVKKYQGQFDEVRINLPGAKIGLAVPKYMKNINSIEDLR